mgnify:CR=1 FL=1
MVYVVLGSLALSAAPRGLPARAGVSSPHLVVYGFIISVARAHDPRGAVRPARAVVFSHAWDLGVRIAAVRRGTLRIRARTDLYQSAARRDALHVSVELNKLPARDAHDQEYDRDAVGGRLLLTACGASDKRRLPPGGRPPAARCKGDFGPPQGEPVHASAHQSAAACRRRPTASSPAKVIVELEVVGSRKADFRRRHLHVLDFRRHRARQLHPRAPGRHGGVPPQESPRQQDASQHRPARRHRSGRRRGVELHGAGTSVAVHLQGAQPGPVRLSLRHRARGHARGQRHVRPHPRRAA